MQHSVDLINDGTIKATVHTAGTAEVHVQANLFRARALLGTAEWAILLGAGYGPENGFFEAVRAGIQALPAAAAFTFPMVHRQAGYLNPVTMEAEGFDGCALAVRREAFDAIGGFDPALPADAALQDFALRLRANRGHIYCLPKAVVASAQDAQNPGCSSLQAYVDKSVSLFLLAYKYGGALKESIAAIGSILKPKPFEGVRRALVAAYLKALPRAVRLWGYRWGHWREYKAVKAIRGKNHPIERGATQALSAGLPQPLISVVVRTCGRPQVLQQTLSCLRWQSYANFEVVVVEDGPPRSQAVVARALKGLRYQYRATGEKVGRSRAGNMGLAMAAGEYCNFLDDDDYFYPEHLQLLAAYAAQNPQADFITTSSVAAEVDVLKEAPWEQTVRALKPIIIDRMDVFTMCQSCQVHVAAVLFKKSLYEKWGGLDENLAAHEDWAMWLRFFAHGRRANPMGVDVRRITTVFTQPANREEAQKRMAEYMRNDDAFFNDESIRFDVSLADMRRFHDGMIADIRHVQANGLLEAYLQNQENRHIARL